VTFAASLCAFFIYKPHLLKDFYNQMRFSVVIHPCLVSLATTIAKPHKQTQVTKQHEGQAGLLHDKGDR